MHNIHFFGDDADSDCPRGGGVPESEESTGKKKTKSNYQQRRYHVEKKSEKRNIKAIGPIVIIPYGFTCRTSRTTSS